MVPIAPIASPEPYPTNKPGDNPLYRCLCLLLSGKTVLPALPPTCEGLDPAGWRALAALAEVEGVAPLLYAHFQAAGWPANLPGEARTALSTAYYRSAARYGLLLSELEKILSAFAEGGVPAIVLKGMALAGGLYPDPALRPMNDLDLLVPQPQVEAAIRLLEGCGYQAQKTTYHTVLWGGPGGQVNLELHWSLVPAPGARSPAQAQDWCWDGSALLDGLPGRALAPAANLLYLSAHLMLQHGGWPRLLWLYDLHLLLSRHGSTLDWPALLARAHNYGWEAPLSAALAAARDRLGSPIPPTIFTGQGRTPEASPSMEDVDFQAWVKAALAELPLRLRLRLLWGLCFPRKAYMLWRYRPQPAWLWPLCYPIRWWRLVQGEAVRLLPKAVAYRRL